MRGRSKLIRVSADTDPNQRLRGLLAQCRVALADQASLGLVGVPAGALGPHAARIARGGDVPVPLAPLVGQARSALPAARAPAAAAASSASQAALPIRPASPGGRPTLSAVRAHLGDCTRCPLHQTRTQIVFGIGSPTARLVFVGEGPGRDEDLQGEPFVGEAGRLLDRMLAAMGTRRDDVYIANIVKCRPPKNRPPEAMEAERCLPFLIEQLASIGPECVVALGRIAMEHLLGRPVRISKERGRWLSFAGPLGDVPLMPTFHPAYLLRNPADKKLVWQDLQAVMAQLDMPPPTARKAARAPA